MTAVIARNRSTAALTALCAGIAAANLDRAVVAATALAGAGIVLSAIRPELSRAGLAGVLLALAGLACGTARLDGLDRSHLASRLGVPERAVVTVTGNPRATRFSVRVEAVTRAYAGAQFAEPVLLQLPAGRSPPRGAILQLARAWPVEPRGPETGFDERAWLAHKGIHVVLRAGEWQIVGRRGGIGGAADRLRARIAQALARGTDGERRALLQGIVLGDDDALPGGLRDAFRASGLAHLTAVSGQNVALIVGGVVGVARLLLIGRLGAQPLAALAVLAYALAVGWQPSVVRATVAGLLVCLAWSTGAARQAWHFMALGALALLAWNPATVLEPGFQLSFAAVAAILLLARRWQARLEGYPLPLTLGAGLSVAAACGIVTAPIVWIHFGVVPTWTVPANLAAEPAMPLVLALGLAAAVCDPFSPAAAATLSWLAGCAASWIAWCARFFAALPHAQIHSGLALVGVAVVLALGVSLWRLPVYRRRRLLPALAGCVALGLVALLVFREHTAREPPQGLRVTFLDVGQGDGTLLEVPEGAILVDQGPPEARVASQLRRLGVRRLTALVLTHPQRDHIGGAADVLRSLEVGEVLDPGIPAASHDEDAALRAAREHSVPVRLARAGDRYAIGGLHLRVLWPDGDPPPGRDPNDSAVVILATYKSFDLLLTADAESNVTERLRQRPVEALKVAHHGSADGGLARILSFLRPRVAVISVGLGNDYGHPTKQTVEALQASPGLRLYRTDLDGQVTVETVDSRSFTVTTQR